MFNRPKAERIYDELLQQAFALDRWERYGKGQKLKQRGFVVIYERFPITDVADHPSIWGWNNIADKSRRRHTVEQMYTKIQEPDLILLLDLQVEEAVRRKSYGDKDVLINKADRLTNYFDQHRSDNKFQRIS